MIRFPPRRILVPFDLSDIALDAWRQAKLLARRWGASVEALYVEEPYVDGELPLVRPRLGAELKAELLRMVRGKLGPGAAVRVVEGEAVAAILRAARGRRADLIVMGTHGRTGLDRVWVGSTAEAVSRLSPVPVLTFRGTPRLPRRVLVPVNFSDYSDRAFFLAGGLAQALGAALTALHVVPDRKACPNPRFRLLNLIARLPERARRAARPRAAVAYAQPLAGILAEAGRHDLLVLAAHAKPLLENLVLGTTAERTIRHAPIPVLTVPAPRRR